MRHKTPKPPVSRSRTLPRAIKEYIRQQSHQQQQAHKLKTEELTAAVLAAVKAWHDSGNTIMRELDANNIDAAKAERAKFSKAEEALDTAWEQLEAHVKGGAA